MTSPRISGSLGSELRIPEFPFVPETLWVWLRVRRVTCIQRWKRTCGSQGRKPAISDWAMSVARPPGLVPTRHPTATRQTDIRKGVRFQTHLWACARLLSRVESSQTFFPHRRSQHWPRFCTACLGDLTLWAPQCAGAKCKERGLSSGRRCSQVVTQTTCV